MTSPVDTGSPRALALLQMLVNEDPWETESFSDDDRKSQISDHFELVEDSYQNTQEGPPVEIPVSKEGRLKKACRRLASCLAFWRWCKKR